MTAALRRPLLLISPLLIACGGEPAPLPQAVIESEDDKLYYVMGLAVGRGMVNYAGHLTDAMLAEALNGVGDVATQQPQRVKWQEYIPQLQALGQQYERAAKDSTAPPAVNTGPLTEEEKNLYYAFGLALSQALGNFVGRLDERQIEMVKMGFADVAMERPHQVDLEVYGPRLNELSNQYQSEIVAEQKAAGAAYLAEMAAEEGTMKTASGILYKELVSGSGAQVQSTDRVRVHYTGTLVDGTQFDSSRDRGDPITFGLGQVVKGWQEGLPLMRVGGRGILVIPSDLAYGDGGRPGIPPGATLVFDIEILGVE